jgi:plasmid stability protein
MFDTCDNVQRMAHIQIRNVPPDLHRRLKIRATEEGLTLSDYLLREAERVAARPTPAELTERIRKRGLVRLSVPSADLIREDRESH